jgi:putative membrane protein
MASGYLIAWVSEFSSIHNGFPYGHYKYVYENLAGELMVAGVPFFDSLSYVFLTFVGFTTACFLVSPRNCVDQDWGKSAIKLVLLGAFLTMMLDVIVDPVATMGEKWFLGKIHYYVNPGWYFGVPLSNFAGWFLVAFAIIGFNVLAWRAFPAVFGDSYKSTRVRAYERTAFLYPLFYISIALFQTFMAFLIDAARLGLANTIYLCILGIALFARSSKR